MTFDGVYRESISYPWLTSRLMGVASLAIRYSAATDPTALPSSSLHASTKTMCIAEHTETWISYRTSWNAESAFNSNFFILICMFIGIQKVSKDKAYCYKSKGDYNLPPWVFDDSFLYIITITHFSSPCNAWLPSRVISPTWRCQDEGLEKLQATYDLGPGTSQLHTEDAPTVALSHLVDAYSDWLEG